MSKVPLNKPAPEFELDDYQGHPVRLANFRGDKHVVLIFNRGFT
jgi:peroxiredoxin